MCGREREHKIECFFIPVADMICSNTFRVQDVSLNFSIWYDIMQNDTPIVLFQKCRVGWTKGRKENLFAASGKSSFFRTEIARCPVKYCCIQAKE